MGGGQFGGGIEDWLGTPPHEALRLGRRLRGRVRHLPEAWFTDADGTVDAQTDDSSVHGCGRDRAVPEPVGAGRNAKIRFKMSEVPAWVKQQRVEAGWRGLTKVSAQIGSARLSPYRNAPRTEPSAPPFSRSCLTSSGLGPAALSSTSRHDLQPCQSPR